MTDVRYLPISTIKKARKKLYGRKVVKVAFTRHENKHGYMVAQPSFVLDDGTCVFFSVHELPDDYAVEMYTVERED